MTDYTDTSRFVSNHTWNIAATTTEQTIPYVFSFGADYMVLLAMDALTQPARIRVKMNITNGGTQRVFSSKLYHPTDDALSDFDEDVTGISFAFNPAYAGTVITLQSETAEAATRTLPYAVRGVERY